MSSCFLTFLRYIQKSSAWVGCWTCWKRKEKNEAKARLIRSRQSWRKEIWLKQSQSKWLALIVIWWEEYERKKRRKGERNKRQRPFGHLDKEGKRVKSQSVSTKCCLSESKQKENRKIERVRENIQWKREQWVKRKREFLYLSCISTCCNLYLI